jgi:hypothetical protein
MDVQPKDKKIYKELESITKTTMCRFWLTNYLGVMNYEEMHFGSSRNNTRVQTR